MPLAHAHRGTIISVCEMPSLIVMAGEAPQGPGLLRVLDSGDENSTLVSITSVDVQ